MVVFYKTAGCRQCEETRRALEDLAIKHRVVTVPPEKKRTPEMPADTRTPLLVDGDDVFEGHAAISRHFEDMREFVALWQKFQTDACYCDEEGNPE